MSGHGGNDVRLPQGREWGVGRARRRRSQATVSWEGKTQAVTGTGVKGEGEGKTREVTGTGEKGEGGRDNTAG